MSAESWAQGLMADLHLLQEQVCLAGLACLARAARDEHPEAVYLLMEESDQGPWMWVVEVLDEDGEEIGSLDDDGGYASWLDTALGGDWCIEPYVVDVDDSRSRGLSCKVNIQAVIDGIEIPKENEA